MFNAYADLAVTSSTTTCETLRIEACDPRADNRRRVIDVGREGVTIRRAVGGIPMAIRVVSSAYRGVTLRVTGLYDGRFRYEVRLLHRDPDLSVALAEGENEATVEAEWREWVGYLRLPALVGRSEGRDVEVNLDVTDLAQRIPNARRRGRAGAGSRRPRFLARRKVGDPARAEVVHADPDVFFYGSKLDR
jgi:hypothetical protein